MLSEAYILDQLRQLPTSEQVERLLTAMRTLKQHPDRSVAACIAMAMDIPVFPKVDRIINQDEYVLTLAFTHGETRRIDFRQLLDPDRSLQRKLLDDVNLFQNVQVVDGTLVWPQVGIWSEDAEGEKQFMAFDVDPALLYEAGEN